MQLNYLVKSLETILPAKHITNIQFSLGPDSHLQIPLCARTIPELNSAKEEFSLCLPF